MLLVAPRFVLNAREILELAEDKHLHFSLLIHCRDSVVSPQTREETRAGCILYSEISKWNYKQINFRMVFFMYNKEDENTKLDSSGL